MSYQVVKRGRVGGLRGPGGTNGTNGAMSPASDAEATARTLADKSLTPANLNALGLTAAFVSTSQAVEQRLDIALADQMQRQTIGRPAEVANAGGGATDNVYVFDTALLGDGFVHTLRVALVADTSLRVQRWSRSGNDWSRLAEIELDGRAGLNDIPLGWAVSAGEYLGIYAGGALRYAVEAGSSPYLASAAGAGNATSFSGSTSNTGVRLEASFDVDYFPADEADYEVQTIGRASEVTATGSGADNNVYVFGDPVLGSGYVRTLRVALVAPTTVQVQRWSRAGAVWTREAQTAVAGVAGGNSIPLDWPVSTGDFLGIYAGGALCYTIQSGSSAYYSSAGGTGNVAQFTNADANTGVRLEVSFDIEYETAAEVSPPSPDLLMQPTLDYSVAGLVADISGAVRRNGVVLPISAAVTFPAAAAGKDRIDLIVMNRLSLAISAVAGVERTAKLDAIEWQPAVPAGSAVVGSVLVNETAAAVANTSLFRGLVKVSGEAELEAHIRRNIQRTRKARGKAMRGAAIKLGGYGDSITALQVGTVGNAGGGLQRDRIEYFSGTYPADTLALIPQYDFGDGGGMSRVKAGWNWAIKAALDAYAGADVVDYINYGIAGTDSANGLDAARIAVPLGDALDIVVIAFGMNERGSPATYGNLVSMAQQFLGVGTDVVLMGCPRPSIAFVGNDQAAWRYTNDAIEAAAMDAGVAYVSTVAITDDRNLGAMGVPGEALGSTNISAAGNHPGYFELLQYGRSAVLQLGL